MDDKEVGLTLLGFMEELYLRTKVQQELLDRLTLPEDDWRSQAERAEILNGPACQILFDKLRAGIFGLERELPLQTNWRSTVRKLLDEDES